MGLFWDLLQEAEINKQRESAMSLEERVRALEEELVNTRELLYRTLSALEEYTGRDIDGDGQVG